MNRIPEEISEAVKLLLPGQIWEVKKPKRVEKIAACYCRFTGDVRYSEESIETQKKKLEEFSAIKGLTPVFFIDNDQEDKDRTEFWRIVGEVKARKVKMVLGTSLGRFSRTAAGYIKLLPFLKKHRVFFASLNEGLDTFTPAGTKKLKLYLATRSDLR